MAWKCVVSFLGVALLGCTSPNPKSCADGFCNDPALPFCDVDGAIAGVPEVCVAVDCTPGEFVACRGDEAIACNADGSNYDVTTCQLGCEATTGCKLCEPNQTACTNGTLATCDANGNIASSEKCGFGCFEDEPRCRDIDPSNALAMYSDMVAAPGDLDLDGAEIHTATGDVIMNGQPTAVTSFLAPAPMNGAMIRVIVARDVKLATVLVKRDATSDARTTTTGPALAIVATGNILVEGRVTILGGSGGVDLAGCSGTAGGYDEGPPRLFGGGGGGAHATAGGRGGTVGSTPGGVGGVPSGTATLIPLRGGCPSKLSSGSDGNPGGGALQLSSRSRVTINGIIDARGATMSAQLGGGGGGGILLEGSSVQLTEAARLITIGGGGGAGNHFLEMYEVPPPSDDGSAQGGVRCASPSIYCTAGGNGAAAGIPAMDGTAASVPSNNESGAGGGGGGLGRIRINTRDQSYDKSSSAVEAGELSVGVAGTR